MLLLQPLKLDEINFKFIEEEPPLEPFIFHSQGSTVVIDDTELLSILRSPQSNKRKREQDNTTIYPMKKR